MKEVLFKLDKFCKDNNIEYAVTGTTALSLLGVPSHFAPQDIDIKVFHLTEEQAKKLEELQFLSGFKKNEFYPHSQCSSFIIYGVKINAIIDRTEDYGEIVGQNVSVNYIDEKQKKHTINVQLVNLALADKMKLKRTKDKTYMLDLIANLAKL